MIKVITIPTFSAERVDSRCAALKPASSYHIPRL
jgi:hypothetical protein